MMNRLKRTILIVLTAAMMMSFMSLAVSADEAPDLSHSYCAYLYNITAGTVLLEKNSKEIIYPGPTVKLMTAAVAIDCLGNDMNKVITINQSIIDQVSGNNINLQDGEEVTVLQLLNALIIGNANDAAIALAYAAAGSSGSFVMLMNERAQALGCKDTFYTNPTGLPDEEMVTTTEDTAKIAVYLNRYNIFTEIANKEYYLFSQTNKSRERKIFNRNYFINTNTEYKYYSPYVTGMNAGSTPEAGYCVVATSFYGNSQFLSIVMGAESDEEYIYSFRDAGRLLNWAYTNFTYMTVLKASEIICELPVSLSNQTNTIALMPEYGVDLYLPKGTVVEDEVKISWQLTEDSLVAPVEKGTVVGRVTILYQGSILKQVDLVTKSDIPRSDVLYMINMVKKVVTSWSFIVVAAVIVGIAIGLWVYDVKKKTDRDEKRKYRTEEDNKRIL